MRSMMLSDAITEITRLRSQLEAVTKSRDAWREMAERMAKRLTHLCDYSESRPAWYQTTRKEDREALYAFEALKASEEKV